MERAAASPPMTGKQVLKTGLVLGSLLLVGAVFLFTQEMIHRLTEQVETTSRVLASFCAQASFPATRDTVLRQIFSDVVGNIDFPIVITDPDGTPRAWRDVGVDPSRMLTARDFETFRVGDVEIQVTPALHDHDSINPWSRGDCSGYLLRTPDGAIWHPGDTRLIDELLEVRDVDVLLLDVAYQVHTHLGPDGSAKLAETSGAKVIVAYHYGTFEAPEGGSYRRALESDPEQSLPFVRDLSAPFLILNPGEPLHLPL
jgi:hypothetical protein